VISSEQEEVLRIFNFISEKKTHCFEWLLASVDIISQEEIVGIGREATVLE
jgi:hypothetical protein